MHAYTSRSVMSYLMHQCDEDDKDELLDLYHAWNLPDLAQTTPAESDLEGQSHKSEEDQPLSSPSSSLLRKKLLQAKRIFVPINDQYAQSKFMFATPGGGSHWSLLVWEIIVVSSASVNDASVVDRDDCTGGGNVTNLGGINVRSEFYHFDSSIGYNSSAARAVSRKLNKVLLSFWNSSLDTRTFKEDSHMVECKTPQQSNGYDCGVFTLGFAEALSSSSSLSFSEGVSGGCDSGSNGSQGREQYETIMQSYFETLGGENQFAPLLRKRMVDYIRHIVGKIDLAVTNN